MNNSNEKEETKIPSEFSKVIKDLVRDIKETFPEVIGLINKWWKESSDFEYIDNEVEREKVFQESQETSIKFLCARSKLWTNCRKIKYSS